MGAQVGVDARLNRQLVAGTALHWHQGWFDWDAGPADVAAQGEYEVEMQGVQPYAGWRSADGSFGLWGTLGYGWGEVEMAVEDRAETARSDSSLYSGALGATGRLLAHEGWLPGGETTLQVKGEVSAMRWEVEESALLAPLAVDSQRFRLTLALAHRQALGKGELMPSLEAGLRHDGGDGEATTGLEVVGGLRYVLPYLGLTLDGRLRGLALAENDYEEWGGEFLVHVDPGPSGLGLALNLTSGYGVVASGVQGMWQEDRAGQAGQTGYGSGAYRPRLRPRLEAELAYGWSVGGRSLFTPYSGLTWLGEGEAHIRLGSRWRLGEQFDVHLAGERRQGGAGIGAGGGGTGLSADHRILLEGRLAF